VPDELKARHFACCKVEARLWSASAIGIAAGEVLAAGIEEYARVGFAEEWRKHHQGGPCGYEPRDYIATPGDARRLIAGQALAWNPSITGTKSEDTILLGAGPVHEVLTRTPGWPRVRFRHRGMTWSRPAILEVASSVPRARRGRLPHRGGATR
jgi:antitoxin VapB